MGLVQTDKQLQINSYWSLYWTLTLLHRYPSDQLLTDFISQLTLLTQIKRKDL